MTDEAKEKRPPSLPPPVHAIVGAQNAARFCGIGLDRVLSACKSGTLKAAWIGGRAGWRIVIADVVQWVRDGALTERGVVAMKVAVRPCVFGEVALEVEASGAVRGTLSVRDVDGNVNRLSAGGDDADALVEKLVEVAWDLVDAGDTPHPVGPDGVPVPRSMPA